jgi:PAS domain S-box-containing protein
MIIHEDYFKNIFDTVREGILILDENMRVLSANRSFYNIFKVETINTIGSLLYDLGNGQWNIPSLRLLLEDILPKHNTVDNYEIDHNFESIGQKIMLLNACKISEKKIGLPIILLAIEDITERKRLENLLIMTEARYRSVFDTSSDGIVLLEKNEGKIILANPASEKLLGYSKEEYIGKKLQDIGVSLYISDFSTIMQTLNERGIINYNDVHIKTKSGQDIETDIYLVDRAGLAQCNIRVVTDRKKLEAQLLQAQKMEAVGLLAGGIAHDFNNILSAIVGYGHLSLMKMDSDDPLRENMDQILASADRASEITHSLLAFGKKQALIPKPININEMIERFIKFLSRLLSENIELITNLNDKDIISMADIGQIEQVLLNLATNARDAMPNGGRLILETRLVELYSAS